MNSWIIHVVCNLKNIDFTNTDQWFKNLDNKWQSPVFGFNSFNDLNEAYRKAEYLSSYYRNSNYVYIVLAKG